MTRSIGAAQDRARETLQQRYLSRQAKEEAWSGRVPFYILSAREGSFEGKTRAEFVIAWAAVADVPNMSRAELAAMAPACPVLTMPLTTVRAALIREIAGAGGEPFGPTILVREPAKNAQGFIWTFGEPD